MRVVVHEVTSGSEATHRWTLTGIRGRYQIRVPAGVYQVFAHAGPSNPASQANLIEPQPQMVTLGASANETVDLQFRASDAIIAGSVTYSDTAHSALVRARSEDGATVHALAGEDGAYTLRLRSGMQWTLQAVSSDDDMFLRSAELTITPAASSTPQPVDDLELVAAAPIPESRAFIFEADEPHIFTMSDDSEVQAPAGAFAPTGTIALTVRPLPELETVGDVKPVSFGYRLHAYDSDRRPITQFLQPVTLVIPYTNDQLAALGITADQLVPSYWDEASASWKAVDNVVVTPDGDGGTVNITVEHFTDFALLGSSSSTVYLPIVAR